MPLCPAPHTHSQVCLHSVDVMIHFLLCVSFTVLWYRYDASDVCITCTYTLTLFCIINSRTCIFVTTLYVQALHSGAETTMCHPQVSDPETKQQSAGYKDWRWFNWYFSSFMGLWIHGSGLNSPLFLHITLYPLQLCPPLQGKIQVEGPVSRYSPQLASLHVLWTVHDMHSEQDFKQAFCKWQEHLEQCIIAT